MLNTVSDSSNTLVPISNYKQYPSRYLTGLLYSFPNLSNAVIWITCSPISLQVEKAYSISTYTVSLCSTIFMLVYLIINFPADYVLDEKGLKAGILVGTILTLIGAWVRVLCDEGFIFILLGQAIAAIGQPFLLNAPAKIANEWFIAEHRATATAILSIINTIGVGIGFLIPGLIVDEEGNHLKKLFLIEAIGMTLPNLATIFFFQNNPPTPPSYAAAVQKTHFLEALKELFQNMSYIITFFAFSIVFGSFNTIATLMQQIVSPFGYNDEDSSYFGGSCIVFGIIGAVIFSIIVEKTLKYKQCILITLLFEIIVLGAFSYFLQQNLPMIYILILISLVGFFFIPYIPLAFELTCEISFPIGEAISTGLLMTGGQLVAVIMVSKYLLNNLYLLDNNLYNQF